MMSYFSTHKGPFCKKSRFFESHSQLERHCQHYYLFFVLFVLSICEQMCLAWDANIDPLYVVDQREKQYFLIMLQLMLHSKLQKQSSASLADFVWIQQKAYASSCQLCRQCVEPCHCVCVCVSFSHTQACSNWHRPVVLRNAGKAH